MATKTLNCIQQRNPGAGFLNEHRRSCAFDFDQAGIEHGIAAQHLNIGNWCGNVCDSCADKMEGRGEKKTRKYKPELLSPGIYLAVELAGPSLAPRRQQPQQQSAATTEEDSTDDMKSKTNKSTTKKAGNKRATGTATSPTSDEKAKELIKLAKKEGITASSSVARWMRAQGFAMSGNRVAKLQQARA